jgi:CelD/BcsL family acetyltransferase involved in cellulose biosynthesis
MMTANRSRPEVRTVIADSVDLLRAHLDPWQHLAENALEANVFYEPIPLLQALEHLAAEGCPAWQVVLLYGEGRLIGLVPMQRSARIGMGLALELLRYRHSYLHTPLFDRDAGELAVEAWLRWCRRESGAALVLCSGMTADGPVRRLLDDAQARLGAGQLELHRYQRPLLVLHGDADGYLAQAVRGDRRREIRRQRRLIEAEGRLSFHCVAAGEDASPWIEGFLALEAGGWKGRNGSALACSEGGKRFFQGLIEGLHGRGRAMLYGLKLDDRWIAMTCHFRAASSQGGAFAFKTAYDEELRALAPGIQLEIEIVRLLHERFADVGWVDSCTAPDNALIGMLWRERRAIARHVLAVPGPKGRLALAALRWGQKAKGAWAERRRSRRDVQLGKAPA